jgi:transposase
LEDELTYAEAAARFGVGYASVSRWLRLQRETRQLAPRPLPGRAPRIGAAGLMMVRRLVAEQPDATVKELAASFATATGGRLAPCIMHRALVKLGLTRKKRVSMRLNVNATTCSSFDGTTRDSDAR